MPSYRSLQIAKALRRTNPLAARQYLEMADIRDEMSYEARKASGALENLTNASNPLQTTPEREALPAVEPAGETVS
jgi:hypothetical protein